MNAEEIPEEYRPLLESLEEVPAPPSSAKQAIRIQIPTIDLDAPVVQGAGWEQLKKGVGQRIGSVNPGELGNTVLAAHNDVYGEIFRYLDKLEKGNEIILYTQERAYRYRVSSTQVVDPTLVQVMASVSPKRLLTLITAYPYLVDDRRFVVQAELQSSTPLPNPISVRIGLVVGHWGSDSGAVCVDQSGNVTLTETDINYEIARLVQQKLLGLGYSVELLKEFDPILMNYKADALVSIHADTCQFINDQATGFKVAPPLNGIDNSSQLVSCLVERYGSTTGLTLHSGRTADMAEYHTFNEVDESTPITIIEVGFLNLDYELLVKQTDRVANGIAKGITCFK